MSVTHLACVYALIGAGWAVLRVRQVGLGGGAAVDVALLIVIWPLYGPLMGDGPTAAAPTPLLTGLLAALPDAAEAQRLAQTLAALDGRIAGLDALLAQPDFDPAGARARVAALTAQGHTEAARAAARRVAGLDRLLETRARCVAGRAAIDEVIGHLRTQVEVARYTGAAHSAGAALAELEPLVEGLDALLEDEWLAAP